MDPLVSLFVFLATLAVGFLYTLWRPVKHVTLNSLLAAIPFLLFFVANVCLGGSALHEAETAYELYEAGHYYLCSHGGYTEVTYGSYLCVKVLEIVGIVSFVIGFIVLFRNKFRGED
jgi:hypothetical protein